LGRANSDDLCSPVDSSHAGNNSLQERRLRVLEPFIAQLTLDVPPPTEQRNIIDRLAAKQIQDTIKKKSDELHKEDAKLQRRQEKLDRSRLQSANASSSAPESLYYSDSSDSGSSVLSLYERLEKSQREIDKINREAADELRRTRNDSKARKIEEKRHKEIEKIEEKRGKLDEKIREKQEKRGRKFDKRESKAARRQEDKIAKDAKKIGRMEYILIENL